MHLSLAGCTMKIIYTRKGEEIFVDDEDYERLNQWWWRLNTKGYATRCMRVPGTGGKQRFILMHREVMGIGFGDPRHVDHRFGIKTDNRKSELRVCTNQQNHWNVGIISSNSSGFKGVTWDKRKRKWRANIRLNNQSKFLGYFTSPEDAHRAYCVAADQIHGEFANYGASDSSTPAPRESAVYDSAAKEKIGG